MRAAVVNDEHGFDVVDLEEPSPGPDELVIRVSACGICGSDLKAVHAMPTGLVMGHEFWGTVVAVGAHGRDRWNEGDLLAALPIIACGRCIACQRGEPAHCDRASLIGVGGAPGGYAEFVTVSAHEAFAVPPHVRPDEAALVEPLAVGLHAVNRARLSPGARVLVIGAGPVGLAVVAWARLMGAGEIVVTDPSEPRRAGAGLVGASVAVEPGDEAASGPFDTVFECVGIPGMLDTCVAAAAVHGTVVVVGLCMQPDPFVPVAALVKEIAMQFVVYYTRPEFGHVIDTLARGQLPAGEFVTGHVDLAGINRAFTDLATAPEHRKILVTP